MGRCGSDDLSLTTSDQTHSRRPPSSSENFTPLVIHRLFITPCCRHAHRIRCIGEIMLQQENETESRNREWICEGISPTEPGDEGGEG